MKPLTIEQLKVLPVQDWIYVIDKVIVSKEYKCILDKTDDKLFLPEPRLYKDYGTKWLAYKNKEQAECKGATYCTMCQDDIFDAYVPVSSEGDICEKPAAPGEEWVYHANYCPNCGRRLISEEAERRLAELTNSKYYFLTREEAEKRLEELKNAERKKV